MQNEMRDRLIELIKQAKQKTKNANCDLERNMLFADSLIENGVVVLDTDILLPENRPLIITIAGMPLNEVIELIKAKREGRIIVPPCKVGDKVYRPSKHLGIVQFVIVSFEAYQSEMFYKDDSENIIYIPDIGKTVFLTKEEAEKALKEGADNG